MKKSELKVLIQAIITEARKLRLESHTDDALIAQMNQDAEKSTVAPDPQTDKDWEAYVQKVADALAKKQGAVSEEGNSGAHPGATPKKSSGPNKTGLSGPTGKWDDEEGYDIDDPKHPRWSERMAMRGDMERSRRRDEPADDAMMMGQYNGMDEIQEGLGDKLNNLFRINLRRLIRLLEQDRFSKDEDESEYYGLTYVKALDLTTDGDDEGLVKVTFSSRKYDDLTVHISEEGFDAEVEEDYVVRELSKKSNSEIVDIFKKIKSHVERTDRPSPNSAAYKAYQQKRATRRAFGKNGMDENKELGASTMKKAPEKCDNTQMGYKDKSITSTDNPKEKKESKKLPIIQKKSNTEKDHRVANKSTPTVPGGEKKEAALPVGGHGALKEELLKMVRESIAEMARTKGALGKSNPNRVAPIKNTGQNYQRKGPVAAKDFAADAEQKVVNVLFKDQMGLTEPLDFDFINSTWPQAKKFLEGAVMSTLSSALDPNAKIGDDVYQKIEAAKEEFDTTGKVSPANSNITLYFDPTMKRLRVK